MITLGVIGVVAALTMPSLVAHYRGKVIKTQLKKSLSVVNQAVRAGMAKEGITESSDLGECFLYPADAPPGVSNFNPLSLCNFFEQNANVNPPKDHTPYNLLLYGSQVYPSKAYSEFSANISNSSNSSIHSIVSLGGTFINCTTAVYQLVDSSIVGIPVSIPRSNNCILPKGQKLTDAYIRSSMEYCLGFIDVNGPKGPNKFALCNDGSVNLTPSEPCEVGEGNIGDIYPIIFHDGIFEMATNAGAYVYNN